MRRRLHTDTANAASAPQGRKYASLSPTTQQGAKRRKIPLAEVGHQQKEARQTFFARIEMLIDQIPLDARVRAKMYNEDFRRASARRGACPPCLSCRSA